MIAKRAELARGAAAPRGHMSHRSDRRQHHRGASCASTSRPAGPQAHQIAKAARVVASHPEQGWGLLCNGVVAFEDTGVRAVRLRDVRGHQSQCLLGTAN